MSVSNNRHPIIFLIIMDSNEVGGGCCGIITALIMLWLFLGLIFSICKGISQLFV